MKQFAPACERNKDYILAVLRDILPVSGLVLEIGSGSGQHAAYFAPQFPDLLWQPTDMADNLPSIAAWCQESDTSNIRPPLALDLAQEPWPVSEAQAVLCINTIHIVSWELVQRLFKGVARVLQPGGIFYAYGPYRYSDQAMAPSNVDFDAWLKARDPASGIRDFEAVDALAEDAGLTLMGDRAMPANNRSLWWRKP